MLFRSRDERNLKLQINMRLIITRRSSSLYSKGLITTGEQDQELDELRASFSVRTPSLFSSSSISKHGHMQGTHVLIILPFLTKSRPRLRFCLKSILHNMRKRGFQNNGNGQCCKKEYDHMSRFVACLVLQTCSLLD